MRITTFFHTMIRMKQSKMSARHQAIMDTYEMSWDQMERAAFDYFNRLWMAEPVAYQEEVIQHITPIISEEQNQLLMAILIEKEILQAINQLPKEANPGPDGFPIDFYSIH